jgi:hypothetical protein
MPKLRRQQRMTTTERKQLYRDEDELYERVHGDLYPDQHPVRLTPEENEHVRRVYARRRIELHKRRATELGLTQLI